MVPEIIIACIIQFCPGNKEDLEANTKIELQNDKIDNTSVSCIFMV